MIWSTNNQSWYNRVTGGFYPPVPTTPFYYPQILCDIFAPTIMAANLFNPRHICVTPGSPSPFLDRNPPRRAIQIVTCFKLGGRWGIVCSGLNFRALLANQWVEST